MNLPKEMYHASGYYRLVHSLEEHASCAASGWSEQKTPDVTYKPLSAMEAPKAKVTEAKPPVAEPAKAEKPPATATSETVPPTKNK